MGLDQYLTAERYIPRREYTTNDSTGYLDSHYNDAFGVLTMGLDFIDPNEFSAGIVQSYPVGQWRKANQVHNWFVQNVQGDEDDCGRYYVPQEKLQELRDACMKVLLVRDNSDDVIERTAEMVGLAPMRGFFFGGYEYDEWYFEQLQETVSILDRVRLSKQLSDGYAIFYSSSW